MNLFSSNTEAAQDLRDEVDKKQKVLVGSKSMRCKARIARFWLRRRRVSQSFRAHSQTRKHWGRECTQCRHRLHDVSTSVSTLTKGSRAPGTRLVPRTPQAFQNTVALRWKKETTATAPLSKCSKFMGDLSRAKRLWLFHEKPSNT